MAVAIVPPPVIDDEDIDPVGGSERALGRDAV